MVYNQAINESKHFDATKYLRESIQSQSLGLICRIKKKCKRPVTTSHIRSHLLF